MTICIAATCNRSRDGGAKIILCTDWRTSSPIGKSDTLNKQPWLPQKWVCLTAGTTTEINAVIRLMRRRFGEEEVIDETTIIGLVQNVLRARLLEKRDEFSYGKFSRGYNDVMKSGKDFLPPAVFTEFVQGSSAIEIEAEFVIAGFVKSDDFLIETTRDGKIKLPTNFACAGEGEYLARASLLQREYSSVRDFGPALYEVFEAKKHAERVTSVGTSTLIKIINEDGTQSDMKQDKMDHLDNLYRQYGPKSVPILMALPDDLFW